MRIFSQDRTLDRLLILLLIVAAISAISWGMRSMRAPTVSFDRDAEFFAETSTRRGASLDDQIQTLQDRLGTHPNDWQSYSQLGLAYLQKAREIGDPSYYQKVEDALNIAIEQQPNDYVTLSAMGLLALARHDFHSALEYGEHAREMDPDRAYAYGVIADAQIELGQYEGAVETLQTMVNLRPDMGSYSRISYLRELHGDVDGALEVMQLAVDGGTPNLESTAWTRTQLGNLYFNTGNLEQAALAYQQTLNERPGYIYALAGLARVRAAQGQMDEAIELFTQATRVMPLPEFVIALGDLYQANHRPELAQQQYDLVGAIEKLYEANGVDMDMEMALFNADHNKELDMTLELAQGAYDNRPSIHAADVLAWVLYQGGNYEEAQIYSQEALRLGTKDALKLFHAGMIAYRLGANEQARDFLEQALAINPHFSILYSDEARKILRVLKITK